MQQKDSSHADMASIKKSRIGKPVKDMSFQEQVASLRKDPRFKELVSDIRQLSPARLDVLDDSLTAMEAEDRPPQGAIDLPP